MEFDDYNYQALNKQILNIKPVSEDSEQQEEQQEGTIQEEDKQEEFRVPTEIAQIQQRSRVGKIDQVKQLTGQDDQGATKTQHEEQKFTQIELNQIRDRYRGKRNSTDVILSKQNKDLFEQLVNMRDKIRDQKNEDNSLISISKIFNKQKSKAQQSGTSAQNALFRQFGIMMDSDVQNSRPKLNRLNSPNWKLKQQLKKQSQMQNSPTGGLVLKPMPMMNESAFQKPVEINHSFETETFEDQVEQLKVYEDSEQDNDRNHVAGKISELNSSESDTIQKGSSSSKHKKRDLNDSSIPLQQDVHEISSFNPSKRGKGKKKK